MLKGHSFRRQPDTSTPWFDVCHCATWEFEREPGIWSPVAYYMFIVVQDNEILDSGLALSEQSARLQAVETIALLSKPRRKKHNPLPTDHLLHFRRIGDDP